MLKTAPQLLQIFSIWILHWLLCVSHFASFHLSLSVWMQLNSLLVPRMEKWSATTFGKLNVGPSASAPSVHPFLLSTLLLTVLLPSGRLHSAVLFSYWLPAMHKLGVFTWKTVGSSLLCITWKSYSCLCILCFTEMCSAYRGHENQTSLTQGHHHHHLLRRWYFTILPQKQARWKKEHHFVLDLYQKKGTRKKLNNVLLRPSPCWILHGYSHWGKQAEMLWIHMSASWFFFSEV